MLERRVSLRESNFSFMPQPHVNTDYTVTPTITVDTAAYAAGDVVGGGVISLVGVGRLLGETVLLQSVMVRDMAAQNKALTILVFNSAPAGTFTDNAPCPTLSAADVALVGRKVSITAGDYETVGGTGFADILVAGRPIKVTGNDLSFVIVAPTGSAPDYVNATDLIISFGFLRQT